VLVLILFVGAVVAFLGGLFWYMQRGEPNAGLALGTNRPYPEGVGMLGGALSQS
jgi:hypothetical protein